LSWVPVAKEPGRGRGRPRVWSKTAVKVDLWLEADLLKMVEAARGTLPRTRWISSLIATSLNSHGTKSAIFIETQRWMDIDAELRHALEAGDLDRAWARISQLKEQLAKRTGAQSAGPQ
jgi:hypothetical protein